MEEIFRLLSPEFDVLRAVRHGQALLDAAAELLPDAVVTDVNMPVMDGIVACECLFQRGFHGAVVLLTMHAETALQERAFRAGARAYVLKIDAAEDLIPAVHAALAGRNYRSRSVFVPERT